MARSAEKAATELSRWYQYKLEKEGHVKTKQRPYLATECHVLKEALSNVIFYSFVDLYYDTHKMTHFLTLASRNCPRNFTKRNNNPKCSTRRI